MKKEYKYTINGNDYEVAIGEIVENEAVVTVNGEEYKVAWEPEAEPEPDVEKLQQQIVSLRGNLAKADFANYMSSIY